MSVEWLMIVLGWFSAFFFVAVSAYKIARIAAMPMNLRWELYPIPHEDAERRGYGGSYMEEIDWVTKPRSGSRLAELLEMGKEIFYLKRVKEHNPYALWGPSMALHWGIYLSAGWLALLFVEGLTGLQMLASLTTAIGLIGFALGIIGALGLVAKRVANAELALYTVPADFFNLMFLAAMFGAGLLSWGSESSFAAHRAYIVSAITFQPTPLPISVVLAFLIFELFLIYMPLTKLIHYFGKHFTFSETLWNDGFKAKDSAADRQIARQLGYVATWSAPHVIAGKTWSEQVQLTAMEEGVKK